MGWGLGLGVKPILAIPGFWYYCYSNSRNGARLFFSDFIKQRDRKYATPPPWKQFYMFLATAPTGVLTAAKL